MTGHGPDRRETARRRKRGLLAGVASTVLLGAGGTVVGIAAAAQNHAPQPTPAQAGTIAPASSAAPPATPSSGPDATLSAIPAKPQQPPTQQLVLARSQPTAINIPAIGVNSGLLTLGLNPDGTIQVPPLFAEQSKAAWYRNSVTPGQGGTSVIEGHVDTYQGPSVFYRLGALKPGQTINVTLADKMVAVFQVTGVRQYPKTAFPTLAFYGDTSYPSLHLITCGGDFDPATRQYLSSTVVYASLISTHPA